MIRTRNIVDTCVGACACDRTRLMTQTVLVGLV